MGDYFIIGSKKDGKNIYEPRSQQSQMDNLDCHNHDFFELQRNLKCKVIFNINILNFMIIHVTIDFNENHIKEDGL